MDVLQLLLSIIEFEANGASSHNVENDTEQEIHSRTAQIAFGSFTRDADSVSLAVFVLLSVSHILSHRNSDWEAIWKESGSIHRGSSGY